MAADVVGGHSWLNQKALYDSGDRLGGRAPYTQLVGDFREGQKR